MTNLVDKLVTLDMSENKLKQMSVTEIRAEIGESMTKEEEERVFAIVQELKDDEHDGDLLDSCFSGN